MIFSEYLQSLRSLFGSSPDACARALGARWYLAECWSQITTLERAEWDSLLLRLKLQVEAMQTLGLAVTPENIFRALEPFNQRQGR